MAPKVLSYGAKILGKKQSRFNYYLCLEKFPIKILVTNNLLENKDYKIRRRVNGKNDLNFFVHDVLPPLQKKSRSTLTAN